MTKVFSQIRQMILFLCTKVGSWRQVKSVSSLLVIAIEQIKEWSHLSSSGTQWAECSYAGLDMRDLSVRMVNRGVWEGISMNVPFAPVVKGWEGWWWKTSNFSFFFKIKWQCARSVITLSDSVPFRMVPNRVLSSCYPDPNFCLIQ